jgi:plastocyanin
MVHDPRSSAPRIRHIPALALAGALAAALFSDAAAAETDIEQAGQRFSQTALSIAVGDTVHFQNHDDVTHNINVIDADGQPDDQGLQKPGDIITKRFDKAGDFVVRCAIHPRMKMKIEVK